MVTGVNIKEKITRRLTSITFCLIVICCAFCTSKKEQKIHDNQPVKLLRAPYIQSTIGDSTSILWRTSRGTKCMVRYKRKAGAAWVNQSGEIHSINEQSVENIVTLKHLDQSETYHYQIFTDDQRLFAGKDRQFNSSLLPEDSVLTFYAVGDIGEAVEAGGKPDVLARAISATGTEYDLGLLLGDIVYPSGTNPGYDIHLFPYFEDVFSKVTTWPVPGNHDWESDFELNYATQWKLPGNEHYYSFDQGRVHFIGLDSKHGEFYDYKNQKDWLEKDLADAQGRYQWIIVFLHHNGRSCTYKDDYPAVISLYPLFEKYQVDLVLNGHAHTYERLKPMNGEGEIDVDGFISITAGSGGKLRGVGSDPTPYVPDPDNCKYPDLVAAFSHTWAFMEFEVNGHQLYAKTIDIQSRAVLDSFKITKTRKFAALP